MASTIDIGSLSGRNKALAMLQCKCGHSALDHGAVSTKYGSRPSKREWKGYHKGQCLYSGGCSCHEFVPKWVDINALRVSMALQVAKRKSEE